MLLVKASPGGKLVEKSRVYRPLPPIGGAKGRRTIRPYFFGE